MVDCKDVILEIFVVLMEVFVFKLVYVLFWWFNCIVCNVCIFRYRVVVVGLVLSSEEIFFEKNVGEFVENEGLL